MKSYVGFVDPSGGSVDSMVLAIAHSENGKAILDGVWERCAPFSPEDVVEEFVKTCKKYGLFRVTGDRYSAGWCQGSFRQRGIEYEPSAKSKSEIYTSFLALMNSGAVEIPLHRRLIAQLQRLERRVARGGRESVDHPVGGHDDIANAAAGALVLAGEIQVQLKPMFEALVDDDDRWFHSERDTALGRPRW